MEGQVFSDQDAPSDAAVSRFNALLWALIPAPCQCRPTQAAMMTQVLGFLVPMWDIWIELPTPSVCSIQS